ncbi:alpha/beta-hydrolase [Aureobasidium melanogenum CBS 110374]|uniref:Alpha/beta-hydrolase n=1 Tax=Aureobasidium melanogenum (strain CBS 110374) TaxID=1043003 RepID=A0A074W6P6_AURM1|nr:alpha/beta-hydrolase [Aureobasidium melanogenum CBS 110374]KEQ67239.1 alpha/beta-hydrolase [Aureobasidium melanogenum CBS 110374]
MSLRLSTRQLCRPTYRPVFSSASSRLAQFSHASVIRQEKAEDPRLKEEAGDLVIEDQYAILRDKYVLTKEKDTPKNPIILAHGLLGFEELNIVPKAVAPGIQYWRGIREALAAKGIEVITATVPPSGSIEARAQKLSEDIHAKAKGKSVNIIAHSMGGLDSRYMISQLKPPNVKVLSLTTIATPHRGSSFADVMFSWIGPTNIPKLYKMLEFFGFETGAFSQLTQKYMQENFNPKTPDREGIAYYSYGATVNPRFWSMFRQSHRIIQKLEGDNDGLVSVSSSKWGTYKGTLKDVSHLDMINWTNRLRWFLWELTGNKRNFNAIAFYLDIADMLAKEGL